MLKRFIVKMFLLLACGLVHAADIRPSGENCNLIKPPLGSGEEGGHGFLIKVFPRTGDIATSYSGCQVAFSVSPSQDVRLAWLVEVVHGKPVRIWSNDHAMKNVLSCRYANGVLKHGDPNVCPSPESLLMPTQSAGCFMGLIDKNKCRYDTE